MVLLRLEQQQGFDERVREDLRATVVVLLGAAFLEKVGEVLLAGEEIDLRVVGVELQFGLDHIVEHDGLLLSQTQRTLSLDRGDAVAELAFLTTFEPVATALLLLLAVERFPQHWHF